MRAARFYGPYDIKVEDVTEPELSDGLVHVNVEWCGICGSDLHLYTLGGGHLTAPLPFVLGHELCGRVHNPPSGSRFKGGEAVMVDPRILCRSCHACKSGNTGCCSKLGYVGGTVSGGYGERVAVQEQMLHVLPDTISLEYAAVIEPLAVVVHAIKEANVKDWAEKEILILGAGPIGFALIIALRAYGAKKILVSEPAVGRRDQIAEYSTAVINPIKEDVVARCKEFTDGRGVEIVFDCAGVPVALESAFDAIRFKGVYMNVAVWEMPLTLPCWKFLAKHVTIKGVLIFDDEDFTDVMKMIADGRLEGYQKMVTGRIPLSDIKDKGFQELINNKDEHIKILVSPKASINASNSSH